MTLEVSLKYTKLATLLTKAYTEKSKINSEKIVSSGDRILLSTLMFIQLC